MAKTSVAVTAVDMLRGLSAEDIRRRLAAIEAEEKALRTLLRAAVQVERVDSNAGGKDPP